MVLARRVGHQPVIATLGLGRRVSGGDELTVGFTGLAGLVASASVAPTFVAVTARALTYAAMRFLLIVTSGPQRPPQGPRDPEHVAKVRKAVDDDITSGRLVATGALGKRATQAARVSGKDGVISVEDPPSGDGWMAGGGYSLIDVASKEEAVARARRTLETMGGGTVELIQVTEMYPPPRIQPL